MKLVLLGLAAAALANAARVFSPSSGQSTSGRFRAHESPLSSDQEYGLPSFTHIQDNEARARHLAMKAATLADAFTHNTTDVDATVGAFGDPSQHVISVDIQMLLARDRQKRAQFGAVAEAEAATARRLQGTGLVMRAVAREGTYATIHCPEGSVISDIRFASYGLPVVDFTNQLRTSSVDALVISEVCGCMHGFRVCCHSHRVCTSLTRVERWEANYPASYGVVWRACVGKKRCDVEAETGLFCNGFIPPWDRDWTNPWAPWQPRPRKTLAIEAVCMPTCPSFAPSAPNAIVRTFTYNIYDRSQGSFATYTCAAGYFQVSGNNVETCLAPSMSFPTPSIRCEVCGFGYYCPGDGKRYGCPNGSYSWSDRHTSWSCGGFCEPGFLCLQPGATNPYSTPCGGNGEAICPREGTNYNGGYENWWWGWWWWGWWWWGRWSLYRPWRPTVRLLVPPGFYSAPLDVPADRRYYYVACPPNRQCVNGVIMPRFEWRRWSPCFSQDLVSGQTAVTVAENTTGATTGLTVWIDTPGFPSETIQWSVVDNVWDPSSRWFSRDYQWTYRGTRRWQRCPTDSLEVVPVSDGGRVASLRLKPGAPPLQWETCGRRLPVVIRASRPDTPQVGVECLVHVDVRRELRPPMVTNCDGLLNTRQVEEGQPPGTAVGAPLFATQRGGMQPGVVMRWFLPDSRDRFDFAIDTCSGQLFTADILNKTTAAFTPDLRTVTIDAMADGASLGMGSSMVRCTLTVNVTRRNNAPTVFTSDLSFNELQPAGTLVGRVEFGDPDFDDVGRVRVAWASTPNGVDSRDPTAFAINATTGAVTATYVIDALTSGIYKYYLTVNVTDGKTWQTFPLTITVNSMPRPPVVPDQTLSILEFTEDGSLTRTITPLRYTHPLNDNVTWWLTPNTTFGVDDRGFIYPLPGAVTLDFYVQPTYHVTAFARDNAGNVASGSVALNVVECNRAPEFLSRSMNVSLAEYSEEGTALGLRATAGDSNRDDTLTYRIVGASPAQASSLLVMDSRTGLLRLAGGLPGGVFTYNESWSWPTGTGAGVGVTDPTATPSNMTIILTVEARDNGIPSKAVNATITVNITDVRPRLRYAAYTMPLNTREATRIGQTPLWMPGRIAGMSDLLWTLEGEDEDALGAFTVQNLTGEIWYVNSSILSYNRRRSYSATVVATYTIPLRTTGGRPTSVNTTDTAILADVEKSISQQTVRATAQVTIVLTHANRAPSWNSSALPRQYTPYRYAGKVGPALSSFVADEDLALTDVQERMTYSIVSGNTPDSAFAINGTNGQLSVVKPESPSLVYDQAQPAPTVTMTIRVCDAGINGPSACAETSVTVEVLEGNLPPLLNTTRLTVPENTHPGMPVGAPVRATDPDPGTRLTYRIVWATVDGAFTINNVTGQVFVNTSDLDFESRSSYTLVVQVTDSGRVPLSASAEVFISLTDVNEAPLITEAGPFFIPENSPVRTSVGFVKASDVDDGDGPTLRFAIVDSSAGVVATSSPSLWWGYFSGYFILNRVEYEDVQAPFSIDPVTGEVWVSAGGLDMETFPAFNVTVRVTDGKGLSNDARVTISLSNVNDRPEMEDVLVYAEENSYGDIGRMVVRDDDAGQGRVYTLGPHAGTHYCTAWQNRGDFLTNWRNQWFRDSVQLSSQQFWYPYTSLSPIDVGRLGGAPLVVDMRVGGPGKARITLSGSSDMSNDIKWSDRYEVIIDGSAGTVAIWRQVASLVSSSAYTYYRSIPSLLVVEKVDKVLAAPNTELGTFYLRLEGDGYRTITFGVRSSNALNAVYTPLVSVVDRNPPLAHLHKEKTLYVTMEASTPLVRITSVCWTASPFLSRDRGSLWLDYTDGGVFISDLDHEGNRHLGVEVEVTDLPTGSALAPAYLNDFAVIEVTAMDINEPPYWNVSSLIECENATISRVLACVTIPENTPAGTIIATIPRAVDPDVFSGTIYTADGSLEAFEQGLDYSFRLDNVPRSAVSIDFSPTTSYRYEWAYASNDYYGAFQWGLNHSSRDVVVVNPELLDFEATGGSSMEYRVWATDFGWESRLSTPHALVVVRLTDVNEPPSLKPAMDAWRVEEMSLPGTLIGTPSAWGASDPDTAGTPFATLTYAITGGTGKDIFNINTQTGQITTAPGSVINYEVVNLYTLSVVVTDGGGLTASATINVTVVDINEQPVLTLPSVIEVPETAQDMFGPAMVVDDPDYGSFHTWSIVGGSGSELFTITCEGRLAVLPGVTLDFEQPVTTFDLAIRVSDNGNPSLFDEKSLFVSIVDANEAPSIVPGQRFVVREAAPSGFVLGNITWTDPDASSNTTAWRTPTFSLASEGNLFGLLAVDPSTGVLSVGSRALVGVVDPTDDSDVTLTINVDVTDGGGLRGRTPIDVKVLGINYPPVWAVSSPVTLSIDENTPVSPHLEGDRVGMPIPATDRNAKHVARLTFAIANVWPSSGAGYFSVQPASAPGQAQVYLTGSASLDFERVTNYTVELVVIDPQNDTDTMNITVAVRDRNEAPSISYPSNVPMTVPENSAAGVAVGGGVLPSVVDPEGDSLTYTITGGTGMALFQVNNVTGALFVALGAALDFERVSSYTLEVTGTDSGYPDGSAAAISGVTTITITVTDVNEVPIWSTQDITAFDLPENSPSGTSVGVVSPFASDVDAGDVLAYSINNTEWALLNPSHATTTVFAINATSGELRVAPGSPKLDFEGISTFLVPVSVSDAGGLFSVATFTVSLTNVNERPLWVNGTAGAPTWTKVFVRLASGNIIGRPLSEFAQDQDSIVASNGEKLGFAIDIITASTVGAGGALTPITNLDLAPFLAIDSSTGQLSLGNIAAFPTLTATGTIVSVNVGVVVSDSNGLTSYNTFTFTTTDNNQPPVCAAQSFRVNENSVTGFTVGEVVATDPDLIVGQTLSFTLTQSPSSMGQPLPFTIETSANRGVLKVSRAGAALLDFETLAAASVGAGGPGSASFSVVVTVTDGNLNFPLSTQCTVTVTVSDVNEAPRLRPVGITQPATFAFSLPENSAAGTVLQLLKSGTLSHPRVGAAAANEGANGHAFAQADGNGNNGNSRVLAGRSVHLAATDEDSADASAGSLTFGLQFDGGSASPLSPLFTVNASTGLISVSSTATEAMLRMLDFEVRSMLTFNATVTDRAGLTDVATVTVQLVDENDPPRWASQPIRNVNGSAVERLSIPESTRAGSALGSVAAEDVDAGTAGVLRYSVVSNAEGAPFVVDPVTGVLSLCPTCTLDWEDKTLWQPTVRVMDTSPSPLSINMTVNIAVIDVFDASIVGAALGVGVPAGTEGTNVPGSSFAASHRGMAVLVKTDGGTAVSFSGANLGLSAARLAREGLDSGITSVTATYGPTTGREHSARSCRISTAGTAIECITTASAGANFQWRFTVNNSAVSGLVGSMTSGNVRTGTLPPTLTNVAVTTDGNGDDTAPVQQLNTTGASFIRLTGSNFGPVGTTVSVRYGPSGGEYVARSCSVRVAHTRVVCTAAAGVGKDLRFTVQVTNAAIQSSRSLNTTLAYFRPVIRAVSAPLLTTSGGESITITGESFGPRAAGPVSIAYAAAQVWALNASMLALPGVSELVFSGSGCTVSNDTTVVCTTGPGAGQDLIPRLTIAGQDSDVRATSARLAYRQPVITALTGSTLERMPTTGGSVFRVGGSEFGPLLAPTQERQNNIITALGPAFLPTPVVMYGSIFMEPTAPMKPVDVPIVAGGGCSGAVTRCSSQCGEARAVCTDEAWVLTSAPEGTVCFEQENNVTGEIDVSFIPSTDARCTPVSTMRYTAVGCKLVVPHTSIECTTAPGVGKWHYVKIHSIAGQSSTGPFPVLSYAPPVITEFGGEGSHLASTAGSQEVVITGLNFGPEQEDIKAVSYGFDSQEFTGVSCVLSAPHVEIRCMTSPGAGARLGWRVRVANQDSVTPLTDYAPPVIDAIMGPGAVDAPTQGGSLVILRGRNFAVDAFLEGVTYGPTGTEYAASACRVTANDQEITCMTVPGTGRRLLWRVTVRGQVSRPSTAYTSYAAPNVTGLSMAFGDTSGTPGVAVYGTQLGVAVATTPIAVYMDRYGTAGFALRDIAEEWEAWRSALLDGDVVRAELLKTDNITTWLASATPLPLLALLQLPDLEEGIIFDVPDGCGADREIVVFTDGVPGSILNFTYYNATIINVAPVRDAFGNLRVVVEGTNFCGRPSVITMPEDAQPVTVVPLNEHPVVTTDLFTTFVPGALDSFASDMISSDLMDLMLATGNVDLTTFSMTGFGRMLQSAGGADPAPSSSAGAGGSGTAILVNGRPVPPTVVTTKRVETLIPEPPELSKTVTTIAVTGAAGDTPATSFSDPSPYFNSASAYKSVGRMLSAGGTSRSMQATGGSGSGGEVTGLSDMDTAGGERVYFPNVTSLNTDDPSKVIVLIGGRNCTGIQLLNKAGGTGRESWIWTVSCLTPPGIGRNLTVSVCSLASTGGCSPSFDNRGFSYAGPVVSSITSGSTSVGVGGASAGSQGIPTAGATITITGKGFGDIAALGNEYTAKVTVTLVSGGVVQTVDAPVISQSDTTLVVDFPQGYGSIASVLVQTQKTAGLILGELYVQDSQELQVRYAAPSVSSVSSSSTSTVGGSVLVVSGSNFGPQTIQPVVTVAGRPCALLNHSHTVLYCTLPAGQGSAAVVAVSVADQTSASTPAARFAYMRPTVTAVTPTSGATNGLDATGAPVTMFILGSNFGFEPVVELRPAPSSAAAAVGLEPIIVPTASLTRNQHDRLEFPMPQGAGKDLTVVVRAGDQSSTQSFSFSYTAPRISVINRLGRAPGACTSKTEAVPRVRDGQYVNRTSRPDCFPTAGGFLLSIQGSSFGYDAAPVSVSIGSQPCPVVSHSHNETVCAMGPGMGQDLPVQLSVAGQLNTVSPAALFSFDAPVVVAVLPNIPFAVGGETLVISGYNFGNKNTSVSILIGGQPCTQARYVNDSQLLCVSPPSTVGPKSLSILAANRTTPFVYEEVEEVVIYQCKTGHYGLIGEECVDCTKEEPGASCPGGELYEDLVTSLPGWYRVDVPVTARAQDREELCHPKRQQREQCPAFLPCNPPGACLGANVCKVGYTGLRCSTCADGYYKLNDVCMECPDRGGALVIIFAVTAIASLAAVYIMSSKGVTWPILFIAIDYAQVLGLMNRFSIKWPSTVTKWLVAASASFLNLELIAPECAINSTTFKGKWATIEMLPLLLGGLLTVCYLLKTGVAMALGRGRKAGGHHAFAATAVTFYRLLYVYIARNTLDVFNCAPLSSSDTRTEYLASNLEIPCYQRGGDHMSMVGAGIAGIIIYLVAAPGFIAFMLYRNKNHIFMDQLARARGEPVPTSDEQLEIAKLTPSSPGVAFRRVWQSLYAPYKPGAWYWEGIVAARKFGIIFTSLMYNRTTTFQQALCLLALFVTAMAHLRVRPYFSADTAARLLSKYDSRVQYKAAEEAKAASFAYRKAKKHSSRNLVGVASPGGVTPSDQDPEGQAHVLAAVIDRIRTKKQIYSLAAVKTRTVLLQRRILLTYPVLCVFLDANSVEATLLFSLILQGLAGVMFGSQLFSGANLERFFAMQYDAMAGATVALMAATAAFIAVCLALDILLQRDPDYLESLAVTFLSWNAKNAEIMADKHTLLGATLGSSRAIRIDARPKSMAASFVPNASAARAMSPSSSTSPALFSSASTDEVKATENPLRAPSLAATAAAAALYSREPEVEPVHAWGAADEEEMTDESDGEAVPHHHNPAGGAGYGVHPNGTGRFASNPTATIKSTYGPSAARRK